MRAATIRRSLVFGVCALGVGALYLAPTLARSPEQLGTDQPRDQPRPQPSSRSNVPTATASPARQRTTSTVPVPEPQPRRATSSVQAPEPAPEQTTRSPQRRTTRVATAYDPVEQPDQEPPQPVREITAPTVTAERLSLNWPAARDNVRVIGYHVWLNGFEVASTTETHATVPWFNDDAGTHVVQVKAVDAAGNESETSPSVLVTRPDPEPSPTPTPEPTPVPEPEEPSAEPTGPTAEQQQPDEQTTAPTTEPTGAPNRTN